jgi:hypothetical protein
MVAKRAEQVLKHPPSPTVGKAGHRNNVCQMKKVVAEFGGCVAEEITPEQIEAWLNSASQWTVADPGGTRWS